MINASRHLEHSRSTWEPPLLLKPVEGEALFLYLVVSEYAVSGALIKEEEKVQWPVYYISKRLIDTKTRYPKNGETSTGPSDRLKEVEAILPFSHHPCTYQLSVEAGPPKIGCFRSPTKVSNRIDPVSYRVRTTTSD